MNESLKGKCTKMLQEKLPRHWNTCTGRKWRMYLLIKGRTDTLCHFSKACFDTLITPGESYFWFPLLKTLLDSEIFIVSFTERTFPNIPWRRIAKTLSAFIKRVVFFLVKFSSALYPTPILERLVGNTSNTDRCCVLSVLIGHNIGFRC